LVNVEVGAADYEKMDRDRRERLRKARA